VLDIAKGLVTSSGRWYANYSAHGATSLKPFHQIESTQLSASIETACVVAAAWRAALIDKGFTEVHRDPAG
jgi:hypothetical protein